MRRGRLGRRPGPTAMQRRACSKTEGTWTPHLRAWATPSTGSSTTDARSSRSRRAGGPAKPSTQSAPARRRRACCVAGLAFQRVVQRLCHVVKRGRSGHRLLAPHALAPFSKEGNRRKSSGAGVGGASLALVNSARSQVAQRFSGVCGCATRPRGSASRAASRRCRSRSRTACREPHHRRRRRAKDTALASRVLAILLRAIFGDYRKRARGGGVDGDARCDAVTFVQRFGDALNLNVHFHSALPDGVFVRDADGTVGFAAVRPTDEIELERLLTKIVPRLEPVLRPLLEQLRRGRRAGGRLRRRGAGRAPDRRLARAQEAPHRVPPEATPGNRRDASRCAREGRPVARTPRRTCTRTTAKASSACAATARGRR